MRRLQLIILYSMLVFVGLLGLSGCGKIQTEILETSVVLNTDDTEGPYQVMAVVVSDQLPVKVRLVYFVNDALEQSKAVEMKQVSRDVFQGAIPGQKAGSKVEYYVQVEDSEKTLTTDPTKVPPTKDGLTYRFRILQ